MRLLFDAAVVVAIAVASVAVLGPPLDGHLFTLAWSDHFFQILPQTVFATLKVWCFWALGASVLGGLLLRRDPTLGRLDAIVGGAFGVWALAFFLANLLGPIGLFRGWVIWLLLAAGIVALWRGGLPPFARRRPSTGLLLILAGFLLILPTNLLLQLGVPVPPFMDILATPASAQRIVTFGYYLPFDNDPYGYWDAASSCPGVELLYAFLALGTHTDPALLAQNGAMIPIVALMLLGTYRLGKSIGGDMVGGMAGLLMFATILLRVVTYLHGRSVTFAIMGAGLGLLLDRRRSPTRLVLSALLLGTAVASHAIIGFFGMVVAAGSVVFWLLAGDVRAFVAGVGLLTAASLWAFPEIAIGLRLELPYPILPAAQLVGFGLAVVSARALDGRPVRDFVLARWLRWALAFAGAVALFRHQPPWEVLAEQWERFPLLFVAGALGLLVMIWLDRKPSRVLLAPVAFGLLFGVGLDYVSRHLWTTFTDAKVQTAVEDFYHKVDYWNPYILVFPAACLFAFLAEKLSPRLVTYALFALLLFPWKNYGKPCDPNYHQHAIVESWAYQLELAKGGYWGATGHRRWAQSEAELELAQLLRDEVTAGRITLDTHVVQAGPYILLYQDNLIFSVYTGINSDFYVADYKFDRSIAGGRLRPAEQLPARLAERPPYVALHELTKNGNKLYDTMAPLPDDAFRDYDLIFDKDGLRLFRDNRLAPASAQPAPAAPAQS